MEENVLRILIYEEQISLTLLDATKIVNEAIRLHALSRSAALVLGKTLAVTTYMSACLKEETGEVSVSVKSDGEGGTISVSGNYGLCLRGYIGDPSACPNTEDEARCFGRSGTITVIRDDGYSRPFVGACPIPDTGSVDDAFGEYYRISEQLPTYIASEVRLDENGGCAFAGAAILQPLPFAEEETLKKLPKGDELKKIAAEIARLGLKNTAETYFSAGSAKVELRTAAYKCNCSREYLSGVLVSLGKEQLEEVLREDGEVKVHCHYCNKDYRFTQRDVDELFP